jgi:hypothetical protein
MNTYVSLALRDLACGAAASLITLILSASFVQATASPRGMHPDGSHATQATHATHMFVALQSRDAWFGQPQPAVLVD